MQEGRIIYQECTNLCQKRAAGQLCPIPERRKGSFDRAGTTSSLRFAEDDILIVEGSGSAGEEQ